MLYPASVRDLLLRLASKGLVRAKWSEQILDECFSSILADRPDLQVAALQRTRELMRTAVPDCLVTGHEELIGGICMTDPNDRHVLAAAIRCGAQAIVTFNLKDFPADVLEPYGIEAKHPDDFVLDAIGLAPGLVMQAIAEQAAALRSPPVSIGTLLDTLRSRDLGQSVAKLHEMLGASAPDV